jgi:Na+-transporting methylmalonyl-CoA/oxaloacetate decarboxylase gamma subunit
MEANEVQELKEQAEHGSSESSLRPVAFTMSVLAVLVAVMTVLGHRTHTEAVLDQNRATDKWNEYQAHKIRSNDTALISDLLSVVTVTDKAAANKLVETYAGHQEKWADDLKKSMDEAVALEVEVKSAEVRAARFDLSEALLEIGLVITSVTLLTRARRYWYLGIVFSICGIASAFSVLFLK